MKAEAIAPFFATLAAVNPRPQTELEYSSVFELLAAVLLSAQATDVGVNKATRELFARAPTPQAMLDLGEARVTELIRTIGLFRTKAKNLMATCRILIDQHGGQQFEHAAVVQLGLRPRVGSGKRREKRRDCFSLHAGPWPRLVRRVRASAQHR